MRETSVSAAEARPGGVATSAHAVLGWAVLLRLVVLDAVALLPRQPVTYVAAHGAPRLVKLGAPALYPALGPLFDSDATPLLLALAAVALALSGGLRRAVLWPARSRRARLLTCALAASPLVWLHRHARCLALEREVHTAVARAFSSEQAAPSPRVPFNLSRAFAWDAYVTNAHGGMAPLTPAGTFEYKRTPAATARCGGSFAALPGDDDASGGNRAALERGELRLDVYSPSGRLDPLARGARGRPVLMHVHGGGWRRGDKSFLRVNYHGGVPRFVLGRQALIVSVSYRLHCLGVQAHEMVEDLLDAVAFIEARAHEWGGDGQLIVPYGTSAGGNLALVLALKHAPRSVKAVVSMYGVTEVREEPLLRGAAASSLFAYLHAAVFARATRFLCESARDAEACFSYLSPLYHVERLPRNAGAHLPMTLLVHGADDPLVLVEHAEWLARELDRVGARHALLKVHGSHDCDTHVSSPCSQTALYALERLLDFLDAEPKRAERSAPEVPREARASVDPRSGARASDDPWSSGQR